MLKLSVVNSRVERIHVGRGMRRGAHLEFKNGEAVAGVQASSGGGGFRDPAMVDAAQVGGRPLVPSMSGGFCFQKASDVQEVPSWSISRPLHSDRSSEDDQGCAPASQSNSPSKPLRMLHRSNVNFYKGDARKEEACLHETMEDHTHNRSGVTSKTSVQDSPYEDTGQPPPELVRHTMLQQDALFREQVQELHRVYKLQMLLMEEMKKKDANSSSTISGQSNMNGRSSWTSVQAAAQEKGSEVSGSTQERGFELKLVDEELKQNSQSSQGGGRKPWKRRMFDLERPPEENMDDEEEEELAAEGTGKMEVKGGLGLSHGWVEPVAKQPQQEHGHGASPRSENSVRGAPFRPTPTMNTQSFLGGLWGLSLDRKTVERSEDRQLGECSRLKGRRPLQLEVDEKPLPHLASRITQKANFSASPWEWQSNGSVSVQPRLQLQQSQNLDVWSGQQQQAQPRPWANASEGAFRASPVMAMRPPPQGYGPYNISEDIIPVFPTSTEGETTHPGLTPAVYNQGYPLTATADPALGMQLRPYEGPLSIPGQGLVVPAMNAAWYPHTAPTFPLQQPLLQTGWQQLSTYHPAPGAIYAVPAAPQLAFNVDGFHRMHEDPSSASWSTSNNGPPFSPFSIIPPPKPPFKRPPKLVLRQDGTTMELKLVSLKKDQSPSGSSDDEVCGLSKERDDSQGEDTTVMKERDGLGCGAFKGIVGGGPRAGGKRELEESSSLVGSDHEREVPLGFRSDKYNRSDTRRSVAEGPMQGSLDRFRDEGDYSDESGSGSGETGVGNVINPGERECHISPASESRRLLPAGEGEEGMNSGELGMQHHHKVVDRWGRRIFFATEDVKTSAEGRKNHYHHKAEAFEEQHAYSPLKPGQISARDIYPFPYIASHSKCSIGGRHGSEEQALPKVKQTSCHRGPQEQAQNAVEVKDKTSKSLEEFERPKQDCSVKEADASRSTPSQDKDMSTVSGLTSSSSLCEAVGVEAASLQGDTGKELQQAVVKPVSEVPLNNDIPAGESVGGEANTDTK